MLKSFAVFAAAAMIACTAFAQKPIDVAVWDDLNVEASKTGGDNRTEALLLEYFKSELATLSRIKVCDSKALGKVIQEVREKEKYGAATAETIKKVCANENVNADFLVFVRFEDNKANGLKITSNVFYADGKKKGSFTADLDNIKSCDIVALDMAKKAAIMIRGKSEVDRLNVSRRAALPATSAKK